MDRDEITRRVRELVAEHCAVPEAKLANDRKLKLYGLDSSRAYELVVVLEDTFGIKIKPSSLDALQTIDDIVAEVARLRA